MATRTKIMHCGIWVCGILFCMKGIAIMSKMLHKVNASVVPGTPESSRHPLPPIDTASWPWPIREKSDWHHLSTTAHCLRQRIDSGQERSSTALLTPGTGVQSFVWRKHENISLCTGSSVNINYRRISSWGGCECWTGNPRISLETPLAAHCWSQRINHSAMTHPSKTDWHQLSGITHWLQ